jgi:hypothetical protein
LLGQSTPECHKKRMRGEEKTQAPPGRREPWYTWQLNGIATTHRSVFGITVAIVIVIWKKLFYKKYF